MKGLLSKEHIAMKSLMKSSAYILFYRHSPPHPPTPPPPHYMGYPPFLQENLDPPFYDF